MCWQEDSDDYWFLDLKIYFIYILKLFGRGGIKIFWNLVNMQKCFKQEISLWVQRVVYSYCKEKLLYASN